ncbi:MAG: DUF5660 domain-containing protein [Candidatus Levybacteria bacterium]|nr:DUF5660 domain-containing protein [Candidatus Levybacteria bacterium]
MKRTKSKARQYVDRNPVEAVRDTLSAVPQSIAKNTQDALGDIWEQFLGINKYAKEEAQNLSGDLAEGKELNLKKLKEEQEKKKDITPGINYTAEIVHAQERVVSQENQETKAQIQQIIVELKKLVESSEELRTEFREITVEQRVAKPGKYHQSFFEWMLVTIRQARAKVEDSKAWLSMFKSKKAKKEYWSMFKKHGTTFGLSNERVVATQVG